MINGYGEQQWVSGKKYKGNWKDNLMHGKGKLSWSDGKTYVGDFNMDKREGEATFTYPDGRQYVGEWKNNKQDGQGTYRTHLLASPRKGVWKEGRKIKWISDDEEQDK